MIFLGRTNDCDFIVQQSDVEKRVFAVTLKEDAVFVKARDVIRRRESNVRTGVKRSPFEK